MNFFFKKWVLASVVPLAMAFTACSDNPDDPSEGSIVNPSEGSIVNGSKNDYVKLDLSEGLQFVGVWNGQNHTIGTKTSPHIGIWQFFNDGTFSWDATDITGQHIKGKWVYDPDQKMILTDAPNCPTLSILSEFEDMISVKNETFGQNYTLSRVTSPEYEVSLNAPHITAFHNDGFTVRISFINHQLINYPTYKYGVSYSYSNNPEAFENVYASSCLKNEFQGVVEEWDGLLIRKSHKELLNYYGGDISLEKLRIDDKIILRPFAEFPDGKIIYGEQLKVKVIAPPEDGIFLGDELVDGKAIFWYKYGFGPNGKTTENSSEEMTTEKIDNAISYLGDGWKVPSSVPEWFRYKYLSRINKQDVSAKLNLYSPVNNVNGEFTLYFSYWNYGWYEHARIYVKRNNTYLTARASIDAYSIRYYDELNSTTNKTTAYLIPCKEIKVTWYY